MIVLLLKVTVLFAIALAMQPLLRRSSAALRHLVCASTLAGALLLPLTLLAPPRTGVFRIAAAAGLGTARAAMHVPRWPFAEVLLALWALGAAFLAIRILAGYAQLSKLLRNARRLADQSPAPVFVADISVPVVAGLRNPVILLPRASEHWTDAQREAALRHEIQHVRRNDLWTLLIGHTACAVYWFHPLAWAVARRSRHEQESACDDAVLASGFAPDSYAEALVAAARNLTSTRLIGCHMLTSQTLKSRIARLFDGGLARIPSRNALRGAAVVSVAAVGLVGILFAAQEQGQSGNIYKVGDGVSAPKVLSRVDVEYSPEARAEKVAGTVLLSVVIGTDGIAHDINVIKGIGSGLDEKAVEAVQQWHFQPGMKDGEAVQVRASIEVNFKLK